MPTLETKSTEMDVEITYGGTELLTDSTRFIQLVQHLRKLNEIVPMVSFTVSEIEAGTNRFAYSFVAKDGRQWEQEMNINSVDPEMNFDVEDFWKLSEFQHHRPIRDDIILLVNGNDVSEIKVTWN